MSFELEIIVWLQSFRSGFFDALFQFFTMFGEELVIIGILGFIYWCYDKKMGEQIGITVFISLVLNSFIKNIVQRYRPYVVDTRIANVRPQTSGGYSFPSGHTQGAASVFGSLAIWMKKRWITIISIIIIILVAISRMYLGVHFLSDVIVGGLLGIGISYLGYRYFSKDPDTKIFYKYLIIIAVVFGLILYIMTLFTIQATSTLNNALNLYDKLEGTLKMLGTVCGFVVGVTFEKNKVQFQQHRVNWKNLIRFALGVSIVMVVRIGLKAIFGLIINPEHLQEGQLFLSSLALLFDTIRYFAMVFVGIGLYPMLFKKFNI
jgi:membrane-associated phospholipid phosphatase